MINLKPIVISLTISLIILIVLYKIFQFIYQYILHPKYKWYQKGNICYNQRDFFAAILTIITAITITFCMYMYPYVMWK